MDFNLLDLAAWTILIVSVAAGFYQGFLATSANTAGCLLALLAAALFYGGMAAGVKAGGKVIPALLYYSETSDMIGRMDVYRAGVEGLTKPGLDALLKDMTLPHPVGSWFSHNVLNAVYAREGVMNLGDYLSRTVAEVSVNIGCFLFLFLIIYAGVTVAVNMAHYVVRLPQLKRFDGWLGGAVGLLRGVVLVFCLFLVVPAVLSMLPVQPVKDVVEHSHTAGLFYQKNFLFGLIRSFIR